MKILMTTMSLDIGGAETHIVELAKELHSRGIEILIASAGGAYVAEIEAVGIRHFTIPMKRRKLKDMKLAKKQLKDLILREKPQLVHAHARIPAFLCGQLHKELGFPFVTTAHWVFSTGGLLAYLTNWGQRVIAVSEDIKSYLIQEYNYPPSHISVTINGIDTEKFSPQRTAPEIIAEFGLKPQSRVLCYVSRMDADRSLVAEQLIAQAEELVKKIPDLEMILVGGGNKFNEIFENAKEMNQKIGRTCIHMTGPRTDINKLVSVAEVFVGVSRSALEAMSAEKVVIVAGNEGYQGIFDKDSLVEAMSGNFCCRGLPQSTETKLCDDVIKAFDFTADEKKVLGEYCRFVILSHYSVGRMAEDCLKMYEDVLKPQYNLVMSGYYGFDNAGDDAILQAIHQQLHENSPVSINITVLSNNPKETTSKYGLNAIPRFQFPKVAKAIAQSDGLISGGGSLLQDRTSTRSILYYLWVIGLAQRYHKPVMLYANGIGPVTREKNRKRVSKTVERATMVSLRDRDSAQELKSMGIRREDLHITADPVQALQAAPESKGAEILKKIGITGEFVTISVREWGDMGAFTEELATFCDHIVREKGLQVLFILMQPARDFTVSLAVQQKMKEKSLILQEKMSPDLLMSVLGRAKLAVAMRLHTLIFSARMGVPMLGMVYDPKVASYLSEVDMPSAGDVTDFHSDFALAQLEILLENYPEYCEKVKKQSQQLEKKAMDNQELLFQMLNKKER